MRRAIFSAKVEHPLIVSFACENCGRANSFAQNISAKTNKNILLNNQKSKIQTDDLNTETVSQEVLERKIEKLLQKTAMVDSLGLMLKNVRIVVIFNHGRKKDFG